jgi:hypothetical protein
MTNQIIVAHEVTEVEVDALRAAWDQAVATQIAAHAAYAARPTMKHLEAAHAAFTAERAGNAVWKAAERALQDMWLIERAADEEARLQAMCEAHDTLEWDYADYNNGSLGEPIPYALTAEVLSYLDHHYQNDCEAGILALDGDSPYGDGTTGWDQPAPLPYYQGTPDLDERDRLEKLAY